MLSFTLIRLIIRLMSKIIKYFVFYRSSVGMSGIDLDAEATCISGASSLSSCRRTPTSFAHLDSKFVTSAKVSIIKLKTF